MPSGAEDTHRLEYDPEAKSTILICFPLVDIWVTYGVRC